MLFLTAFCVSAFNVISCKTKQPPVRENPLVFYAKFFADSVFQKSRVADPLHDIEYGYGYDDEVRAIARSNWRFDEGLVSWKEVENANLISATTNGDTIRICHGVPDSDFFMDYTFVYKSDTLVLIERAFASN